MDHGLSWLILISAYMIMTLIGLFAVVVLWKIYNNKIDLKMLISEKNGDASMSRFQFLIFTFVIGMGFLLLTVSNISLSTPTIEFPKVGIEIFALLGMSSGGYLISKGIQKKSESGGAGEEPEETGDTAPRPGSGWPIG